MKKPDCFWGLTVCKPGTNAACKKCIKEKYKIHPEQIGTKLKNKRRDKCQAA